MTSFAAAVAFLAEWIGAQPVEEMCLAPGRRDVVRLMNLHKAKGLEARVVWLANPAGVPDFEPDRHIRRTDGKPRGHFRFTRSVGYQSRTVSQPAGWDDSAAEERAYEEAEEDRLMYVAATRARDLLVVSAYAGDLGERRSWGLLERGLEAVAELPMSPPPRGAAAPCPAPPARKKVAVSPKDANEGRAALLRKMAEASRAGSLHETVTALAKRDREPPEWARGGLGTWGSEVHVMLKTLGASWPSDGGGDPGVLAPEDRLTRMARDVLVAADRNPGDCRDLARHVAAVVRSGFWLRAMRAERRLFEVPFSIRVRAGEAGYGELAARVGSVPVAGGRPVVLRSGAPIFLSGAIDLLFRESGWVLADFKTDRPPRALTGAGEREIRAFLDSLLAYYRPQVELYTRFWAELTGDKVRESGLYFTALDRWVPVDVA
jgi:ATP-dependent helicase/nuclease subunit A